MRVHQQPAYVLLNRPYSETSWIVDVFTQDYGRLSLVAKGARRLKSKLKGVLLPFQPLLLSWSGKGEMPTLTAAELNDALFDLYGEPLICGFYCNELLVNLLHRYDPHIELYQVYHETVASLNVCTLNLPDQAIATANVLREFERSLIKQIGYEIDFEYEAQTRNKIQDDLFYQYIQGQGFVRIANSNHTNASSGRVIKSLNSTLATTQKQIPQSKKIMRDIMNQLLGHKKIHSRDLFFPKSR